MRWMILVLVIIVLIVAFAYSHLQIAPINVIDSTEIVSGIPSTPYVNSQFGYTIQRPATSVISYAGFDSYLPVTLSPVAGFPLPMSAYVGTNIKSAGIYIGATSTENAVNDCLYESAQSNEKAIGTTIINGTTFNIFTSIGTSTRNGIAKKTFRTLHSGSCIEITQIIRTGMLHEYSTGTVKEFDRDLVTTVLDRMLNTFMFNPLQGGGVRGKVTVGSICPTDPSSEEPCVPQPLQTHIGIYQASELIKNIPTSIEGRFETSLPSGKYELRVESGSTTRCASVGVVVPPEAYISTDISCDAGGR